jgi:catechol 2,3-dioxygenase-like lactoylglutathione lyase family enzyme
MYRFAARRVVMEPSISFITLGVADLERATRFYANGLGLPQVKSPPTASFFDLGSARLALYPRTLLAADAGVSVDGSGFPGFALAHNVRSKPEADQLLNLAAAAGGRLLRPAGPTAWGVHAGYFADLDGFLWEVAWNPRLPHIG